MHPDGILSMSTALGIRAGGQFAVLLVLVRFSGLDAAAEFILALAIAGPVFVTAELGLRILFVTSAGQPVFAQFLILRALGVLLALLVSTVWFALTTSQRPWLVFVLVLMVKAVDSFADIFVGVCQRVGSIRFVAAAAALNGALTATCSAALGAVTGSGAAIVAGSLFASIIVLGFSVNGAWGTLRRPSDISLPARRRPTKAGLIRLGRRGLPIGTSMGVAGLVSSIPVLALSAWGSAEQVALFGLLQYVVFGVDLLTSGGVQSQLHRLREEFLCTGSREALWRAGRDLARRWSFLVSTLLPIGLLLLWAVSLARHPSEEPTQWLALLPIVLACSLLPWLAAMNAVMSTLLENGAVLLASVLGAFATLACCLVTVPAFGVLGAALGVLAGVGTRAAYTHTALQRVLDVGHRAES